MPLNIGVLVYPGVDQIDVTGPFEVFARIPGAKVHVIGRDLTPVRDVMGFILTPELTLLEAPALDILHVPGGYGQEAMMDDDPVLSFIRAQMESGRYVFSVCTGALICGAAGILRGRRATTHWTAFDLLPFFGATPVDERVVVDGNLVSAAGVTSGIDGALTITALVAGEDTAKAIQLAIEYAPKPPFDSGTPKKAPAEILQRVVAAGQGIKAARVATAKRIAARLGIEP